MEVLYSWSLKLEKMNWPVPSHSSLLACFEWVAVHPSLLTSWWHPWQYQVKKSKHWVERLIFNSAVSSSPLVGGSREGDWQWHYFGCPVAWLKPLALAEWYLGEAAAPAESAPASLGRRNTVLAVILDWQLVESMGHSRTLQGPQYCSVHSDEWTHGFLVLLISVL